MVLLKIPKNCSSLASTLCTVHHIAILKVQVFYITWLEWTHNYGKWMAEPFSQIVVIEQLSLYHQCESVYFGLQFTRMLVAKVLLDYLPLVAA